MAGEEMITPRAVFYNLTIQCKASHAAKNKHDGGSMHLAEYVMYDNKYSIPFLDIYFLLGP